MTTIAFDGKTLATDSMRTWGNMACGYASKIHKFNGGVIACAGMCRDTSRVVAWLNGGEKPTDIEDFQGFIVRDDGSYSEIDEKMSEYLCIAPSALGSGAAFAMTAMVMGKSAVEAVEVAKLMDVKSGGEVFSHELPPRR